jgi:hypothetical protein
MLILLILYNLILTIVSYLTLHYTYVGILPKPTNFFIFEKFH